MTIKCYIGYLDMYILQFTVQNKKQSCAKCSIYFRPECVKYNNINIKIKWNIYILFYDKVVVVVVAGAGDGDGVVVVVVEGAGDGDGDGDGDVTPERQIFPMLGRTVTAWNPLGVDILPASVQLSATGL